MVSNKALFELSNKTALVVGIGGLGTSIAKAFSDAGADVAVADIDLLRARHLSEKLKNETTRSEGYETNVCASQSVQQLADAVISDFGKIDILVNAFGITKRSAAEDFPEETWDSIIDTNMKGTFLCCQAVGRYMLKQCSGSIINLSSIAGSAGLKGTVAYCASKGGVDQLTRTLGVEWAKRGVRVNAIAPSWFETEMGLLVEKVDQLYLGTHIPEKSELINETIGRVPIGRYGNADEIAGAALFLASAASSMVTGHILAVDGGFLAQ